MIDQTSNQNMPVKVIIVFENGDINEITGDISANAEWNYTIARYDKLNIEIQEPILKIREKMS